MIFGIGTDITDVGRIQRSMEKDQHFIEKVFTSTEIDYCEQQGNKYQSYAARFCAKEAFMKALGLGFFDGIGFNHIEIQNSSNGKPTLVLYDKAKEMCEKNKISNLLVSISHEKSTAVATVILEC